MCLFFETLLERRAAFSQGYINKVKIMFIFRTVGKNSLGLKKALRVTYSHEHK